MYYLFSYDPHNPKYKELIDKLTEEEVSPELQEEIDKELHSYCLNSIGNIVLLDKSVNRSYGNAEHNKKVNRITSEFFSSAHYIRPFTASVFLQKDSETVKENWHWGIKEIQDNANNISKKMSEFLGWENK